jgi:aminoglycoside phosphotransferase (APT) family kinase protein
MIGPGPAKSQAPIWATPELPGRLEAFLRARIGKPTRIASLRRLPAGLSWVTIAFVASLPDGETLDLILRLGDRRGLLSPYSARPEFLAVTSLIGREGLPLARAYWYTDDESVLGAPFIITQRIEGRTPTAWKGSTSARDKDETASVGNDFVDALAAIHSFDWTTSPIAELAEEKISEANVAKHQISRWTAHINAPGTRPHPHIHYARRWLEANAPVAERLTIVHGDYRVGNFLEANGRITAILDWELVHLGAPHEDFGWAGLRQWSGGSATRIGGLVERGAFYARYEKRTGFRVNPQTLRFYEILALYKVACMLVGGVQRTEDGRAHDLRMAAMGFQLAPALRELFRLIEDA